MAMLNLDLIRQLPETETSIDYTEKDVVLHALGIGLGGKDERELKFVVDEQLVATPMFAMILGHRLAWLRQPETGIDVRKMLHGESSLTMHQPLPAAGRVVVHGRIAGVVDRGPGKSVSIYFEQCVLDGDSHNRLATVGGCFVFPGAGALARSSGAWATAAAVQVPSHAPDVEYEQRVPANAAQLYRLNGDRNPLHVDPQVARRAGFEKPILHGLCTFGFAGAAALRVLCDHDAQRIAKVRVRYSAPLLPGERLRTEFHRLGANAYAFRSLAVERGLAVLDAGEVVLRGTDE
jgi:acyl dehydratase